MFFTYGTRLAGQVEFIEDLGHVETEFFHISSIPLFPLRGAFVREDGEAFEIPISKPSILSIYLRWLAYFFGFCLVAAGVAVIAAKSPLQAETLAVGLACSVLGGGLLGWGWWFAQKLKRKPVSESRREELTQWAFLHQEVQEPEEA